MTDYYEYEYYIGVWLVGECIWVSERPSVLELCKNLLHSFPIW